MQNTFGHIFRLTSFGESHGAAIGGVIDGCPSQIELNLEFIQQQLSRRRPGQNQLTTTRQEEDRLEILSGLENNFTLGTPIGFLVKNKDAKPSDYEANRDLYRPSHSDYTSELKYGVRSSSGGGRLSARETIARVVAGSIAEQVLCQMNPTIKIIAAVESVYKIQSPLNNQLLEELDRTQIDQFKSRCPIAEYDQQIQTTIMQAKENGDSVGGVIRCLILNPPKGLGEPVFDKLDALLAQAMISIPAVKGFEIGSGFSATTLYGSEHNDPFYTDHGLIKTRTNNSGGIQGGISNGETIWMRVAFKPTSTIQKQQETIRSDGKSAKIEFSGRHDPCVLARAVPIVESMAAIVLLDLLLQQKAKQINR